MKKFLKIKKRGILSTFIIFCVSIIFMNGCNHEDLQGGENLKFMETQRGLIEKIGVILIEGSPVKSCLIGFDGFTDEIISVVDKRFSADDYTSIATISALAKRIDAAGGKSCNLELVTTRTKIGGNAPIFTRALSEGDYAITFLGAIGADGYIEPLFEELSSRCSRVVPLCPSGHTDALEFSDGKVLLGKLQQLELISYESLLEHVSKEVLIQYFDESDLFASCNWTMLPKMTSLWQKLCKEILPNIEQRPRWMFVDLADPAKRSIEDFREALHTLTSFTPYYRVVLGLNESEALQAGKALQVSGNFPQALAKDIVDTLKIDQVVIHTLKEAFTATSRGSFHRIAGTYYPKPVITTGGGDHFNAGYCQGLLHEFSEEECLLWGVATSGFYVSEGKTPTINDISDYLKEQL